MAISPSHPASSLHPPDPEWRLIVAEAKTPPNVEKRFLELQAQIERLEEENQKTGARNLVLETVCRGQRRSLDEKDDNIFKLEGERDAMSEAFSKMKEKCVDAREELDRAGKEWKMRVAGLEKKYWDSEVERKKVEIDLEAERKEIERIRILVEEMAREKKRIELELHGRVLKLEEAVSESDGLKGAAHRILDLRGIGLKYVSKSPVQLKREILEEAIQMGHVTEALDSKDLEMRNEVPAMQKSTICVEQSLIQLKEESLEDDPQTGKEGPSAQKATFPCIVEISDDEEEEEKTSACNEQKTKVASSDDLSGSIGKQKTKAIKDLIYEGTKGTPPSFTTPSTPLCGEQHLEVHPKRKAEAVRLSVGRPSETKRSKCDGPKEEAPWNTEDQMCDAFNSNDKLCMEAVCALYRKHKSLGAWKYHWNRTAVYVEGLELSAATLGEFLTGGDREGRLKKSLADLAQENSRGLEHCRFIAKKHSKLLLEIYSNHQDPLYKP